jgi:bifunctional DNA-binding transcriptional regulator/antitoxin component of YhaV-PrlF toxin-antitoxin module
MTVPVIFRVTLGKTGNSLRITIPNPVVEGFGWKEKDQIMLIVTESEITVRKLEKDRKDKARSRPAS